MKFVRRTIGRLRSAWNWEALRLVLALASMVLTVSATTAAGATLVVTKIVDTNDGVCDADCSLREAIIGANALAGADTITLPAGTYALTIPGTGENVAATGDLDITANLTINGAGAASTIIDGGGLDRVIEVRPGATVQINAVTVRNGNPGTGAACGLPSASGGGILNCLGTLTVSDSTVSGNTVGGLSAVGGGIFNFAGTLTLTNSTVSGNTAAANGGGIFNESGTLTLDVSTVSDNTAVAGGGIYNHGAMALTRSTVNANSALAGSGGGIIHEGGVLTLTNSTVSGNTAAANGGGIFTNGTALTLSSSTVTDNAAASGGGIFNASNASLNNTIVANNVAGGNCSGNPVAFFQQFNHNLSSDATCAFAGPGDLNNANPLLGPLANNGGSTETHALLAGSPAIDVGSCTVSTDQRGITRPQPSGGACDIGAYEEVPCIPPPSGMVAWWPLDEGAGATSLQDLIGGNNATLFASPLGAAQAPQPVSGTVKGAIHFPKFGNGLSGARVSPQGALATVGSADFTIDAWVEFQSAPANRLHYIVNRFNTAQNTGYALYVISPGIAGNERLEFKWGDGTTVSTVQTISPITPGWHHMAVTFARNVGGNALDIRLYVDGAQQGQQTGNPPGLGSLANSVDLEIGQQPSPLDEPITIDELEIFNVALAQSDIQAIYNAGSAGKCKCGTGGQSMDLTTTGTGAVFGVGSGVGATVSNPVIINYSVQGCSGHEMFLVLNAPPMGIPWAYLNASGTWVPLPTPLSLITPWMASGPPDGLYTLFSGSAPPGTYDLYLACDAIQNGHLDITGPPLCLTGAFDYLPLTVQ